MSDCQITAILSFGECAYDALQGCATNIFNVFGTTDGDVTDHWSSGVHEAEK